MTNERRRALGPATGSTQGYTREGFSSTQESITTTPSSDNSVTVNSGSTYVDLTDQFGSDATKFFHIDQKQEEVSWDLEKT